MAGLFYSLPDPRLPVLIPRLNSWIKALLIRACITSDTGGYRSDTSLIQVKLPA